MKHVRTLFETKPFYQLVPDQNLIVDGPFSGGEKIKAAMAKDSTFAIMYSPRGKPFTVDQSHLKTQPLKATWYDPRYGVFHHLHTGNTFGIQTYTPPSSGRGQDWILILE